MADIFDEDFFNINQLLMEQDTQMPEHSSKKLGKTGPKPKEYTDEWLMSVPLYKRTTNRSYGTSQKASHVTIHRLKKKGRLRAVTASNHPTLSDNHKVARLKWVLNHVNPVPSEGDPTFVDMQHYIHIDEKWFYLNPETMTFYLTPNKETPYRAQQSKRFKLKAMFMGMIGKPLYDEEGNMIHSGKYGLFPFVKYERAKKKSKNREAGTLETKAIQSVNREAIDEKFLAATQANEFNIQFVYHPAQSLDLNVLDLGLCKVIQLIQYQSFPKDLDELIEKVAEAFEVFDPTLNKYSWITLRLCMIKILEKQGGNNFNPPHMAKARQNRKGTLEEILEVSRELISDTVNYLNTIFIPTTGMHASRNTRHGSGC
ncbi:uncharacterized protein LOC110704362 [Chenopodium quinoa]|uniref:uncharacterized protein LOC110704362 n=1 Tax=Chenopodium quinoa TaxID=63459 RepID=UPI000B79A5AE|nr:uncharacterized protein LOC110704362 [Chenopodium quinoa]